MRLAARAYAWPILVLLTAALAWPLVACPPSYVPDLSLWAGIHEADLVVAAKIVDIDVNDVAIFAAGLTESAADWLRQAGLGISRPSFVPTAALTLEVEETIEGEPRRRITFRLKGLATELLRQRTHQVGLEQ